MYTKEQLVEMLGHIQHYCHEQWNCDKCKFRYEDGCIDKCVFCGILTIDSIPPDEWNLSVLSEKMLGGKNEKKENT